MIYVMIDEARFIFGAFIACFLMCYGALPKRNNFSLRLMASIVLNLIYLYLWYPVYSILQEGYTANFWYGILYVVGLSGVQLLCVYICYAGDIGTIAFRCLLGKILEALITLWYRYIFVYVLFPKLPETHLFIYLGCGAVFYLIFYGSFYELIAKKMQVGDGVVPMSGTGGKVFQVIGYFAYGIIVPLIQIVSEWLIQPLHHHKTYGKIYVFVYAFSVLSIALISVIALSSLYNLYTAAVLERDKTLSEMLLKQKQKQYDLIKENTDMINQKCHVLKRQLTELKTAEDEDKNRLIEDVRRALNFYDAVVKTGDETLDTILTEKSLICANRGIKLSCIANIGEIEHMKTIDLYGIMDLAIDQAISYESAILDPEKKLISVLLTRKGEMIYFSVENYMGDDISRKELKKRDQILERLKTLLSRYDGSLTIWEENHIFQIQMILSDE
ncbi:MAG: GHKL domain-containing protein [Lachnospiraceae bacterium]|nr:GHKL domain-containing protein [Lachnospiraceae bacterium]